MSKVEIREVESKKDLKKFVKVPFSVHRDHPEWVPPLIMDRMDFLNRKKNPYFDHADVKLWIAEKDDFKEGIFPNNSVSGDLEKVAHYTQVMWRSSRAVGCAVAHGRADDFLVCRYSEGGNVIGERPF